MSGFFPPSSRQAAWPLRPVSSPIREPTADDPVKPTLSTSFSSSARSRPSNARGAVRLHEVQHAVGQAARDEQARQRVARRRRVLGGLPDDRVAAQDRRHEIPGGHGHREVAGGDDRRHADRRAEREELLVGHLARHGLPVQAAALGEEEVAGVDDLLHLAERLGIRLADLARDEPGERLLVVLDDPADLLDDVAAHRRGHGRPLALRRARGAAGVDEDVRVAQLHLADDVLEVRRVARLHPLATRPILAADDRPDGPRVRDAHAP